MDFIKRHLVAITAAAFAVAGVTAVSASAYNQPDAASAVAPANSVTGGSVVNGSLYQKDINPAVVDVFRTPKAGSVWQNTLNDGIVTEPKLSVAVRAKLNAPDANGKAVAVHSFDATTVAHIGGSFKTNKTKLGEFTLPGGHTYRLDASFFALRTVAGAPGTRPQLALRVGASETAFGDDYGTVMGAELSPTAQRELTGAGFKYVTVATDTTVGVYGFGYNDDASGAGGGEFTMSAQVGALQVG